MTTVSVSMSEDLMAFINARIAEGAYDSPEEYLLALVQEARKRRTKQALEAKLREALESGPATPMTSEDWVALRQEALDGLAGEHIEP